MWLHLVSEATLIFLNQCNDIFKHHFSDQISLEATLNVRNVAGLSLSDDRASRI